MALTGVGVLLSRKRPTALLTIILIASIGQAFACDRSDMLKVSYFFFGDDTYLPIKFKDMKKRPDGFLMHASDFTKLILESKPAKEEWFENIRMSVKTDSGEFFINKDGLIYFNEAVIGQVDKEILNSIDFGFGLYEAKSCAPLNIRMTNLLKQGSKTGDAKEYLDKAGELADWRKSGFVGYVKSQKVR